MVNRVITGAHYGFRDWLAQRISAVVMAVYTILLVLALIAVSPNTHDAWRGLFAQGWMRFATFIFFVALVYHVWIGIRDIFMDYVKPTGTKLVLHSIVVLLLVGYLGWAAQILWRL